MAVEDPSLTWGNILFERATDEGDILRIIGTEWENAGLGVAWNMDADDSLADVHRRFCKVMGLLLELPDNEPYDQASRIRVVFWRFWPRLLAGYFGDNLDGSEEDEEKK